MNINGFMIGVGIEILIGLIVGTILYKNGWWLK